MDLVTKIKCCVWSKSLSQAKAEDFIFLYSSLLPSAPLLMSPPQTPHLPLRLHFLPNACWAPATPEPSVLQLPHRPVPALQSLCAACSCYLDHLFPQVFMKDASLWSSPPKESPGTLRHCQHSQPPKTTLLICLLSVLPSPCGP